MDPYLQNNWGNQALNLGGAVALFLSFLEGQGALDDILFHIIFLGKVEELADLGSPLRSKAFGDSNISESGNFL